MCLLKFANPARVPRIIMQKIKWNTTKELRLLTAKLNTHHAMQQREWTTIETYFSQGTSGYRCLGRSNEKTFAENTDQVAVPAAVEQQSMVVNATRDQSLLLSIASNAVNGFHFPWISK